MNVLPDCRSPINPWRLQAEHLGPLVTVGYPQSAPLLGIYKRGATVVFSPCDAIYLTTRQEDGPFNVFVPGLSFHLQHLRPGQMVRRSAHKISIPAARLTIDLKAAGIAPAAPVLQSAPWDRIATLLPRTLQSALDVAGTRSAPLNALAVHHGLRIAAPTPSPLIERFHHELQRLHEGTRTADVSLVTHAAQRLLGLGNGLTPAGDDLLAGYLAVLALTQDEAVLPRCQYHLLSAAILAERHTRTNALSASLLWAAAQGEVNEALARTIQRLLSGQRVTVKALVSLGAVGSSSGLDGLAGVLIALKAAVRRRLGMNR